MKKLFVILLLLVTLNATSQNKTVVLKVSSIDANNYLTKADSLSGGYTTWLRTKKVVDSLGGRFSNYLPLTGGTLTGPLNGTSATFSGKISSTSTGILLERLGASTSNQWLRFQNTGGSFIAGIESSAGGSLIIGSTAYDGAVTAPTGLSFSANDGTNLHLRIASTGAATFASRVNVNGAVDDGTTALKVNGIGVFTSGTSNTQLTVNGTGAIKSGINFANGGTTYGQIYFDNNAPYNMSVLQQYSTGSLILGTNNTANLTIANGGAATFSSTLGINGVADNVKSGTYTPTGSNAGNVGSITMYQHSYIRVGNVVTVSGVVEFTPTAGNSLCTLEITLPVASTFTTSFQANGAASNSVTNSLGYIRSGTNKAQIIFISDSGPTSINASYTFQYQIL